MAKRVQRRRGTTTEHNTFTGYEGEITVDITKDTAVIHDGSTAGGFPLARQDLNNVSLNISIADMNIVDGTNGQFLQTNGSGTMSFATIDASSTAVGGDVTGTVSNIQIAAIKVGFAELNVSDGTSNQFIKENAWYSWNTDIPLNKWIYDNRHILAPLYLNITYSLKKTYNDIINLVNFCESNNHPYMIFDGINNHIHYEDNCEWYLSGTSPE